METAKVIFLWLCLWMPENHARIATKQAIIESGWFKSSAVVCCNNPFGIMWKGQVQNFNSLEESCYQYYRQIYCQYNGGDYYEFLLNLPYATDKQYIQKVKQIKLDF